MNCAFESDLTALLDGELSSPEKSRLDAHLPSCASCRTTMAGLTLAMHTVDELKAFSPSLGLRRKVLAEVNKPRGVMAYLAEQMRPLTLVPAFGSVVAVVVAVAILRAPEADLGEGDSFEVASNLELVEDYELLGLSDDEDLEVVQRLHELEGRP